MQSLEQQNNEKEIKEIGNPSNGKKVAAWDRESMKRLNVSL